jgi:UDP:flavonoid glycosyltransferase YjiC (YdhE family)
VRVLFAFTGGRGHAEPLVPIARAAEGARHEVAFAGRAAHVAELEALGFRAFASGREIVPERRPLVAFDMDREQRVMRDGFAGRIARSRATDLLRICGEYDPDLIVCDEVDFGAMVAAERLGLPHASVLVIAAGSFVRPEIVGEPIAALREEHGLPPDPDLAMLGRDLVLSPFPPSFRDPADPLPATAHSVRLAGGHGAAAPRRAAPLVYFTLGTVFPLESGDLFPRVLAGLGELPIEAVVTVGTSIDPGELGAVPQNVRVERFVPHSAVLPRAAAVVCHGGSGTVIGALAYGLPLVTIPMGADQPLNAARCEALGVGLTLDAMRAQPGDVRDAVSAVLADPAYRAAAERVRDEIAALPGTDHALALLERLVAE